MQNEINNAIATARANIAACKGTYMEEIAARDLARLDSAAAVGLIVRTTAGRDCDWSVLCPKCGEPVVGFGESPFAECRDCGGAVTTLNGLALFHG